MRLKHIKLLTIIMVFLPVLTGCFNVKKPVKSRSEGFQQFLKICKEELNFNVIAKPLKNTLYIYLPIEHDILTYKAKEKRPSPPSKDSKAKQELKFVNAYTKIRSFIVEYDAISTYSYASDYGYSSAYTEKFTKKQNSILIAVYRAFGDLEIVPGNREFVDHVRDLKRQRLVKGYVPTEPPPDFVVLVISNIKKGIEVKQILAFEDYKRRMSNALTPEEYQRRSLYEIHGWKKIIGDKTGKHIDFKDMTWLEFLAKQMENRIKLKYKSVASPPSEKTDAEVIKACYETIAAYQFGNFDAIQLSNLLNGENYYFTAAEFLAIEEKGEYSFDQ